MPTRVCIGCKYYKECGSSTRVKPCAGRKVEKKSCKK